MLVIRDAQMAVFEDAARRAYEERLVAHVGRVFPAAVARLGVERTRAVVKAAAARAAACGMRSEIEICLFVDLAFGVHPDFEQREEMAWARPILEDRGADATIRLRIIYEGIRQRGL